MGDSSEPMPPVDPRSDPEEAWLSSWAEEISADSRENSPSPGQGQESLPLPRRRLGWSGWLIGIVCGILAGLWAIPPVRYTLSAQLQFAISEDSVPWLLSLDASRSIREAPRLDAVASLESNASDYLLQVGKHRFCFSPELNPG